MLALDLFAPERIVVAPGAFYFPSWLTLKGQRELIGLCRQWASAPTGFRTPRMADGTPLSIKSIYLGWDWKHGSGYTRMHDETANIPVRAFPPELAALSVNAYEHTFGTKDLFAPDSAILNWYDENAKLGMHQDRGETDAVRIHGSPVISISLGDAAVFRFGNTKTRGKPFRDVVLKSGDLFVFGGPSRMAYHGITKVFPGTAPAELGPFKGRLNITIRETGL